MKSRYTCGSFYVARTVDEHGHEENPNQVKSMNRNYVDCYCVRRQGDGGNFIFGLEVTLTRYPGPIQ